MGSVVVGIGQIAVAAISLAGRGVEGARPQFAAPVAAAAAPAIAQFVKSVTAAGAESGLDGPAALVQDAEQMLKTALAVE